VKKALRDRLGAAHNDPDRRKIVIVATADYLARVAGAMLLTGELWRLPVHRAPACAASVATCRQTGGAA
jgi:hypothetical protein